MTSIRTINISIALIALLLTTGCARLSVKTYKEHRQHCTTIPYASVLDAASLVPAYLSSMVYSLGGVIIMPYNVLGGLGALATAGLMGIPIFYLKQSAAYGWTQTAKCRRELKKLDKSKV
jgi:hypothetical protein